MAKKNSTAASHPTSKEVTGHHREREGREDEGEDKEQRVLISIRSGKSKIPVLLLGNVSALEKDK